MVKLASYRPVVLKQYYDKYAYYNAGKNEHAKLVMQK